MSTRSILVARRILIKGRFWKPTPSVKRARPPLTASEGRPCWYNSTIRGKGPRSASRLNSRNAAPSDNDDHQNRMPRRSSDCCGLPCLRRWPARCRLDGNCDRDHCRRSPGSRTASHYSLNTSVPAAPYTIHRPERPAIASGYGPGANAPAVLDTTRRRGRLLAGPDTPDRRFERIGCRSAIDRPHKQRSGVRCPPEQTTRPGL